MLEGLLKRVPVGAITPTPIDRVEDVGFTVCWRLDEMFSTKFA